MWITIIILAYVANVFLNRWLNKIAYNIDKTVPVIPPFWFTSLLGTCILLIIVTICIVEKTSFTGKNWE